MSIKKYFFNHLSYQKLPAYISFTSVTEILCSVSLWLLNVNSMTELNKKLLSSKKKKKKKKSVDILSLLVSYGFYCLDTALHEK